MTDTCCSVLSRFEVGHFDNEIDDGHKAETQALGAIAGKFFNYGLSSIIVTSGVAEIRPASVVGASVLSNAGTVLVFSVTRPARLSNQFHIDKSIIEGRRCSQVSQPL